MTSEETRGGGSSISADIHVGNCPFSLLYYYDPYRLFFFFPFLKVKFNMYCFKRTNVILPRHASKY